MRIQIQGNAFPSLKVTSEFHEKIKVQFGNLPGNRYLQRTEKTADGRLHWKRNKIRNSLKHSVRCENFDLPRSRITQKHSVQTTDQYISSAVFASYSTFYPYSLVNFFLQGKVSFVIYKDTMNAKTFLKFVKRLIKDATQKIFLILDNLRVHHSYVVKEWLENHKDEIELFFLPSYSPELNSDEYLNCDLKAWVHSGVPARTKDQLGKKAISHLRMLQKKPKRVQKYFEHHKIVYAA